MFYFENRKDADISAEARPTVVGAAVPCGRQLLNSENYKMLDFSFRISSEPEQFQSYIVKYFPPSHFPRIFPQK